MDKIIEYLEKIQRREGIKEFPYSCLLIENNEFINTIPKILEQIKTLNFDKEPYKTSFEIIINESLKISDILYDDEENEKLLVTLIGNLVAIYINSKLNKALSKH
jgi:hypothetical protein